MSWKIIVWLTVSKAFDKSSATRTVRSHGLCWFKPCVMLWWYYVFYGIHVDGKLLVGVRSAREAEGPLRVFATGNKMEIRSVTEKRVVVREATVFTPVGVVNIVDKFTAFVKL